MKLKGISIFEQHVEKVVLLLFALIALGVFVMQFDIFGDPNAVKIGQREVPPDAAVEEVRREAQRVRGQMEGEGENVEIPDPPGVLALVERELREPMLPTEGERLALAPAWSSEATPLLGTGEELEIKLGSPYVEVTPPAPTGVYARSFAGTIDPLEVHAHDGLEAYVPEVQPHDARAVSVQATFDAAGLREMLSTVPENPDLNPLPRDWWLGKVELLDVELIRQEMYEDGTTGAEEVVGALPGRFSLRERIRGEEEAAPRELPALLRAEADHREEIRRPAFYNMIAGEAWVWPAKAAEMERKDPRADQIKRLVDRYRNLAREAEEVERRIEALGESPDASRPAGGRQPGGSRGDAGDVGGWPSIPATWLAQEGGPRGRPQDSGGDSDSREQERRQAQIQALRERLGRIQGEMQELRDQLGSEFGVGVDGKPLEDEEAGAFTEELASLTGPDTLEAVTVWGHDLDVEPGATYRYRVRVWVTNPLFGNGAQVPEEQAALALEPAIASAASAWSEPVRVYPERAYFVTGAVDASGGGLGLRRGASASVDVYEFYYGYWRRASVSLDQGDQVRVTLELPELPVFTLEENDQGSVVVKDQEKLPTARTIAEDALLLEVGRAIGTGGSGEVQKVIFGLLGGGLEVRVAGEDAESPLASVAWASSEAGAEAEIRMPGEGMEGSGSSRRPRPGGEGERETPRGRPSPGMRAPDRRGE